MKKIFGGLILIFCLIQISLVVVCAGESTQKCTYTEKYNYVTDIEELLELGEVQPLSNETGQISRRWRSSCTSINKKRIL